MASTKQLIEQLSNGLQPAESIASPFRLFIKWIGFSSLYLLTMLIFFNLRLDIHEKFSSPKFIFEILMLALVVITSALSAIFLSFPDMYQKRWLILTPIFSLILFIITLIFGYITDNSQSTAPVNGIDCLLCITLFSLFPAFLMFVLLRRQATTHYYTAGALSLLAASSIGAITLRFFENTDSMIHLIKWHYAPMIAFGIIGLWLGKRFFKW